MSNIVKVDMSEFGLEETKAAEIRKDFDAVLKIATELEAEYNEIVSVEEITKEQSKKAKALRLRYSKMRTGLEKVRKERKAFYLSGGRAVDGLAAAYKHAVCGNEDKLKEIETHFDRIEKERLDNLQEERAEKLSAYVVDAHERDLIKFEEDEFNALLSMKKQEHEDREALELKLKEEKEAKEKADAEERERVRKENEQLRAEVAEKERIAKAEADKRAKEERARKAKELAEQKERERIEAERVAKEQEDRRKFEEGARIKEALIIAEREEERKEAEEKLAKERAERERVEAEAKAKADAEAKAKKDADARAKDQANRKAVNNAALDAIVLTMSDTHSGNAEGAKSIAKAIVMSIAKGEIPNVSITY